GVARCVRRHRGRGGRESNGGGKAAMRKLLRGAFVIGRRDFSATVLSKTFLFFLLGPIFPLLFGATFGGIVGGQAAQRDSAIVAVIASQAEFDRLEATRERLNEALGGDRLSALVRLAP